MTEDDVIANYEQVQSRIRRAAQEAARSPDAVELTVVSKTWPTEKISPLLAHGHRRFGENRVQEAQAKWPALKSAYPDCCVHLIGALQSNKAADTIGLFDVVESLDREKLVHAFRRLADDGARLPAFFVQVNTGEEAQKSGVLPADAVAFVDWCRNDQHLDILGLMAIPPQDDPPAPHFALLHELAAEAGVSALSMGMSGDYETAVHLGATMVRVGSAIFGPRGTPQ
ncbi:hypothetical protein PB2503_04737 [Parvularcula bermudensis HTCC2503]|uniref:Pyridoxal phosphate homeostasis protein n=1 Tax=Parvularcula bermudensis (strain ATCC BAA-594 / HTCC2503 / KCTC 12087) TaxID=314260 RepID=E0TFA4_PARBH|nr:YggS family pyridoxal phosphate-dependent enzyme [Parvularcula bermudensis]ADM09022.1 hypothetical protein PB2503_04737 [Parvularcula bermudensis HTCC2503]